MLLLDRKLNKGDAESSKVLNSVDVYIRFVINTYSAIEVERDFWLTEREKDFFVAAVIHYLSGELNPASDGAIQIYKKYFNFQTKKAEIADYLNRLSKKQWIKYNKRTKEIQIPEIFKGINLQDDVFEFRISVILNDEDHRRDRDRVDTEESSG